MSWAQLVGLCLVVEADQLNVVEGPDIEGHGFKAIWRIMGAIKGLYLDNDLVVW